ncbi:MAG: cytochrome c biogenesis protein ResB, partial [Bacteroidales bacterium]|nr:cytochrome c biogenesis protein ResB [Bacteroidales bacterium]
MKFKKNFIYLLLLTITMLAVATFLEKLYGSAFVYKHVYGAWYFTVLWAILALACLFRIIKGHIYRNIPLCLLHLSFIIILLGAFLTKTTSMHGYIILNSGVENRQCWIDDGALSVQLPFSMMLDSFYIATYPGTNAPADYVSCVTVQNGEKTLSVSISMNSIFTCDGYRFYQTSYENDLKTSVLSINRDVLGIPFTYSGYALFALSMCWLLCSPKNRFRKLLQHPLLKKAFAVLLFFTPLMLPAQTMSSDSLTVSRKHANEFARLWMLYDGRITPVATFAQDFTQKIAGKKTFAGLNANQFMLSMLFFPQKWQRVALFEISNPELKLLLNAQQEKAAWIDFFDENGNYKLMPFWNEL